jgi:hypothetical protein
LPLLLKEMMRLKEREMSGGDKKIRAVMQEETVSVVRK